MSRRKGEPPDDPRSIETMRSAALQCLDSCCAVAAWAQEGEEAWSKICQEGRLQILIDRIAAAAKAGAGIEHESRLTVGPTRTFGGRTARNAHMAALLLARRMVKRIEEAAAECGSLEASEVRAVAYPLFGYTRGPSGGVAPVPCDFGAWRETIEWEAAQAARLPATRPDQPTPEPPLGERRYDALDALYDLKAFTPDSRATTASVADNVGVDPAALKEPVADLVGRGLAATKKGRAGGVWLTPAGRELVERQRKR